MCPAGWSGSLTFAEVVKGRDSKTKGAIIGRRDVWPSQVAQDGIASLRERRKWGGGMKEGRRSGSVRYK